MNSAIATFLTNDSSPMLIADLSTWVDIYAFQDASMTMAMVKIGNKDQEQCDYTKNKYFDFGCLILGEIPM
jgi:hypothetical protein